MRTRAIILVGAGSLAIGAPASAELVGAKAVNLGDIGAGVESLRVYLIFDDPNDQLLGIGGDADLAPLIFDHQSPLVQNNLFEGMSAFDDVPTVADLGGDSWVTISENEGGLNGADITHNTAFSPNFLGGDGMESVIKGSHFEQLDNGGWYDEDPGTPALPDENGQILIAQFSVELDYRMTFQATAAYKLGGGDLTLSAFSLVFPGPGPLALLGVAAAAGGRRRRV